MKLTIALLLLSVGIANAKLLGNPTVEQQAYFDKLTQVIYQIEGGAKAKYLYGIVSIKYKNEAEARKICNNTIRNNWYRWKQNSKGLTFDVYLASVYCPIGAANDPKGLNVNWLSNFRFYVKKYGIVEPQS
jgi:hypothetical protein